MYGTSLHNRHCGTVAKIVDKQLGLDGCVSLWCVCCTFAVTPAIWVCDENGINPFGPPPDDILLAISYECHEEVIGRVPDFYWDLILSV